MAVGSSPVAVTETSDIAPVFSKKFLDIQPTIECGFTLNRVRDNDKNIQLPNGNELQLPPIFIGDSAFPYHLWLQKPFGNKTI